MQSIIILRSNAVNPDPRVEKITQFLQANYKVFILAWDRERTSKKNDTILNSVAIHRFGPQSKFGTGIKGIVALFKWQ